MITIIDYGMGNLRSVQKGFARVGYEAEITDRPERVAAADKLVLPGVGAFGDAMDELRRRDLVEPICDSIAAGRPFLGICLGLQLLFDSSDEGGLHAGLGILPGRIVRFDLPPGYKVPHMGWNQLELCGACPLLDGTPQGAYVYFVHSYYAAPRDPLLAAAVARYPEPFAAVVARGNVMATQFHPEKSQTVGLEMLRRFAKL